jgi:hypothetical protein
MNPGLTLLLLPRQRRQLSAQDFEIAAASAFPLGPGDPKGTRRFSWVFVLQAECAINHAPIPPNTIAGPVASSATASTATAPNSVPVISSIFSTYARSRMLLTDLACHRPPRAVAMPRAFSASAICRNVVAPAFWASRMMGRTLAA